MAGRGVLWGLSGYSTAVLVLIGDWGSGCFYFSCLLLLWGFFLGLVLLGGEGFTGIIEDDIYYYYLYLYIYN